jgi:hypothetical protein
LEANSLLTPVAAVATFFAFTSGMIYIYEAFRQIQAAGPHEPPNER